MSERDADEFQYGDWVEFKLDTDLFGIVVGLDPYGLIYSVQLAGSGLVRFFYGVTLELMDTGDDEPGNEGRVDDTESNVIDFTKAVNLRRARTEGSA